MPDMTRRGLLGGAAAAGVGTALPPNVRAALAEPARSGGSLRDIEHVVILMQENRSFDHYFGTLSGVRGFADPHAPTLSTGRSVFHQPYAGSPDGYLLPFPLRTRATSGQAIPSTSHEWHPQHDSWHGGKMDGWLAAHTKADGAENGPFTMSYLTRDDIPFHYALADAFTICDNYFCSVFGPTNPNRLYLWSGTIDPGGTHGGPVIDNSETPAYTWTTYPERLQAAGVTWRVYQEADNYDDNALAWFRTFQEAPRTSPLWQNGMQRYPAGGFEYDALTGKLPQVSWIVAPTAECEHPAWLPGAGAAYVASKIDAIAANRELWSKTLFVLTYDENDGLFDHVPPPTPPAGTPDEFVGGLPIGFGFRVPTILVSPWTTGGYVCSDRFDHTSLLRILERVFGVPEPNISAWRRRTSGDLTSALRLGHRRRESRLALPDTAYLRTLAEYEVATLPAPVVPTGGQPVPAQEPGRRPRVP